jgi:hypothetical protein
MNRSLTVRVFCRWVFFTAVVGWGAAASHSQTNVLDNSKLPRFIRAGDSNVSVEIRFKSSQSQKLVLNLLGPTYSPWHGGVVLDVISDQEAGVQAGDFQTTNIIVPIDNNPDPKTNAIWSGFLGTNADQHSNATATMEPASVELESIDVSALPTNVPTIGSIPVRLTVTSGTNLNLKLNIVDPANGYAYKGGLVLPIPAGTIRTNINATVQLSTNLVPGRTYSWASFLTLPGQDYADRKIEGAAMGLTAVLTNQVLLVGTPTQAFNSGGNTVRIWVSSVEEQDLVVNLQNNTNYTFYGGFRQKIPAGTSGLLIVTNVMIQNTNLPVSPSSNEWIALLCPVDTPNNQVFDSKTAFASQTIEVVTRYSTWATGFEIGSASLQADSDGDGFNNLMEYALLGNPTQADSGILGPKAGTTNGYLTLTYRKRNNDPNLAVLAQASPSLGASSVWSDEGQTNGPVVLGTVPLSDGEEVTVRAPRTISEEPKSFLRIKASLSGN